MNFKIILLFLFFFLLAGSGNATLLEEEWSYPTGAVTQIFFEDLTGDGSPEIIIWSGDTLQTLNLKGSLLWSFQEKNLLSVAISDLNSNGQKEVIVSSGKRTAGTERSFLWILNSHGEIILKYPPSKMASTILLANIKALDLNDNGYKEIIAGTSQGVCVFLDDYNHILWYNRAEISSPIKKIITGDITGSGKKEILAKSFSTLYLVDYNGNVEWNYSLPLGIKEVYLKDVSQEGRQKIILTSTQKLIILDEKGEISQQTEIPLGIKSLFTENLDEDPPIEFILLAERKLFLLDDNLMLTANYSFNDEEEIKGIWLGDFDLDPAEEIIVFTNKRFYCFWKNLTLKFDFPTPYPANKVFFLDHSTPHILINAKGVTYSFKVNNNFWRKKLGDDFYGKALTSFNLSFYENASSYLTTAKEWYEKAGYLAGLSQCEELLQQIKSKERRKKIQLASFHYERALHSYNYHYYKNATHYLLLAQELFLEANDSGGISKCDFLLRKIKEIRATTSSIPVSTTLPEKQPPSVDSGKLILGGMLLSLTILLLIFILRKKIKGELK